MPERDLPPQIGAAQLSAQLALRCGLNPAQSRSAVDAMFRVIEEALLDHISVILPHVGTFQIVEVKARTDEGPRVRVRFRAIQGLRGMLPCHPEHD